MAAAHPAGRDGRWDAACCLVCTGQGKGALFGPIGSIICPVGWNIAVFVQCGLLSPWVSVYIRRTCSSCSQCSAELQQQPLVAFQVCGVTPVLVALVLKVSPGGDAGAPALLSLCWWCHPVPIRATSSAEKFVVSPEQV